MSMQGWIERLTTAISDGPTLTGAARASCIPVANRIILPSGFFQPAGRALRIRMGGRISCAVTTPGTARLDICLGAAGTTIVYDTGAQNLNIVAKVAVPWYFEVELVCRATGTGTSTNFFPSDGRFTSEAVVGAAVPTAGSNGTIILPTTAPAVGAGTDVTAAHALDVFFTQTVGTGSFAVHTYSVDAVN